jgi:Ca2+-binding RTX toxin-like protein
MRRLGAVLTLAVLTGASPAIATASTVRVDPATGFAEFVGGPGPDDVTTDVRGFTGDALPFLDVAGGLVAGPGCAAGTPVLCQARSANVYMGAGADRYNGAFTIGTLIVSGGAGDDYLVGNGIQTTVSGDAGDDTIQVGSNGAAFAYGGAGDDDIRDNFGGVEATLNGEAGNDLVYGSRSLSDISGGAGDDDLFLSADGTVAGGAGDDVMIARLSDRSVRTFDGGAGDDTIIAGGGSTVSGGAGDDIIDVLGNSRRQSGTVDCGAGKDAVYADADDVLAPDCENRIEGPMPTSGRVDAAVDRLARVFDVSVTP